MSNAISRSDLDVPEPPELHTKQTLQTQRHPMTEQQTNRELFLPNGTLDVKKLLTVIAGTRDMPESTLDNNARS